MREEDVMKRTMWLTAAASVFAASIAFAQSGTGTGGGTGTGTGGGTIGNMPSGRGSDDSDVERQQPGSDSDADTTRGTKGTRDRGTSGTRGDDSGTMGGSRDTGGSGTGTGSGGSGTRYPGE
jgi:hypothetical protein